MANDQNIFSEVGNLAVETFKAVSDVLKEAFTLKVEQPIKVAVIGECGVGKTSTINALFGTNLPVSHFGSCTQYAEKVVTKTSNGATIEVYDLPGLWAGEAETKRHWETYKRIIPEVDSAIWVVSAGDRALEGMQKALKIIEKFAGSDFIEKIVFGVNKSEHMFPENWNNVVNLPSKEQANNLDLFCNTVRTAILEVFPNWNGTVKYYSALKQFRLNEILEQMIRSASGDGKLRIVSGATPREYAEKVEDDRAREVATQMIMRGDA